ncbi:MAG: GTP-binding protein [Oscillospiraceae bacterium]|jgi:G3E family GTPase|nr:GTP-binding protein [Oscillospiraceae bacterium]
MTTVDIYSGFLGAGKTTLIKKMIREAYQNEKIVLIENEFGEIGIDSGFMQDAGIAVNEMNAGCICCSLVGDFSQALAQVIREYQPDRILIEPSGVGKLSDVIAAVKRLEMPDLQLGAFIAVADAGKCKLYLKNFGEFYSNQIEAARAIVLSRTANMAEEKLAAAVSLLREHNKDAVIITTPWEQLSGEQILQAIQREDSLEEELEHLSAHVHDEHCCHHHHEHDEHCHHEHEHDEHCHHHHEHGEHCHHEHEHDEHCHHDHEHGEHCHHDHEHGEHCHHDHEHGEHCHHHHDADEIFASWGVETPKKFSESALRDILSTFASEESYGLILRAKGIVQTPEGSWLHFDYVPGETEIRSGSAAVTGRLCVIGSNLHAQAVAAAFGL